MNGGSDDIIQRNEHAPYVQFSFIDLLRKGISYLTIQEKAANTHE